MSNELSINERLFVAHLFRQKKFNYTEAYMEAYGCLESTASSAGSVLANTPRVTAAIEKKMVERLKSLDINQDYVLDVIEKVTRCSSTTYKRKKTIVNDNGDEEDIIIEIVQDPTNALKGAELLGRTMRMFVERTEITGANGEPLAEKPDLSRLSEDELGQLLALQNKILAPK